MQRNGRTTDPLRPSLRLIDSIERLQSLSRLNENDWLDLLHLNRTDYYSFRSGFEKLPYHAAERIAEYFQFKTLDLFIHKLDFLKIAQLTTPKQVCIPDPYLVSAYGRLRGAATAIESLEKNFGWRLKHDVIKQFQLFDPSLMNPFSRVSIGLMTDICEYLHKRQFTENDFFNIGLYSYDGNRHAIIGRVVSQLMDFRDAFQLFSSDLISMFGQNHFYDFQLKDEKTGLLTVRSNPDVAAEMSISAVGSAQCCQIEAGAWASLVSYFDLSLPLVAHPECEHRGDSVCRFVFDFSTCSPQNGAAK